MSALAEALVGPQRTLFPRTARRGVALLQLDSEAATDRLTECGITDPIRRRLLPDGYDARSEARYDHSDTDAQTEQAEAARWATESDGGGAEA